MGAKKWESIIPLCDTCALAIATLCEFMAEKDKEKALAAMGAKAKSKKYRPCGKRGGHSTLYKVISCPYYQKGSIPSLLRCHKEVLSQ